MIRFTVQEDMSASEISLLSQDVEGWQQKAWTTVTLPEPVQLEAGREYEAGFDEDGRPYVRAVTTGGV
jgi:hypothetical protein